jgi:hypothetical protein
MDGLDVAVISMNHEHRSLSGPAKGPLLQFLGVVKEFAAASLVVIAFACVILVLGLSLALAVRGA